MCLKLVVFSLPELLRQHVGLAFHKTSIHIFFKLLFTVTHCKFGRLGLRHSDPIHLHLNIFTKLYTIPYALFRKNASTIVRTEFEGKYL